MGGIMNNCYKNTPIILFAIVLVAFMGFATGEARAQAQNAELNLELVLSSNLTDSEVIPLQTLIQNDGKGQKLFDLYLENLNTNEPAENLYFNIILSTEKHGTIVEAYQEEGKPFSLRSRQQVIATNNTIGNGGLPGIKEYIGFDGGLTSAGDDFYNNLKGSTKLPPDTYSIQVDIYQGHNSKNGGIKVASTSAQLGVEITEDVKDIYLTSPGDVIGSSVEITNPYPEFRWEGANNATYRLVVVEAKGDESPESLIQGALSTDPILENGKSGMGSLLDHEILDAKLNKRSFQFPTSGVKSHEEGQLYFWQVLLELKTSNGIETRPSEIWEYSLAEQGTDDNVVDNSPELRRALNQLLGQGQFKEMQRNGYKLQSIVIDGQTVSGAVALQRIADFLDRVEQGDITIVNNN